MTSISSSTGQPEFIGQDLRGARFVRCDLARVVMRDVDLTGADIDGQLDGALIVNGVDVAPLVEAELNQRFPGRGLRSASDAEGLGAAWNAVQAAWGEVLARAEAMPEGTFDISVDGEWSLAQTLRHLVMATDVWLRGAILWIEQPIHPIGLPFAEYEADGFDMSIFTTAKPTLAEVLTVRSQRQAMVGEFLAAATPTVLTEPRANPWAPEHSVSVGRCLGVILNEEWEHLRYATRDLDAIQAPPPTGRDSRGSDR
jgi:uncharacterized protein YjbI with pentapeptide repeats